MIFGMVCPASPELKSFKSSLTSSPTVFCRVRTHVGSEAPVVDMHVEDIQSSLRLGAVFVFGNVIVGTSFSKTTLVF